MSLRRSSLLFVLLLGVMLLAAMPHHSTAATVCPSDGISHDTSGSTATGATCNEAFTNLVAQESVKIDCEFGIYSYEFFHNRCFWNGSAYQVTGWYTYECQTDCHSPAQ